jgi:hypothetical protein
MRRFSLALIVALAVVGVSASTVVARAETATSSVACREPSEGAEDFRRYIIRVTMGQDTASTRSRMSYRLPAMSDSTAIAFVTDTTLCNQAAAVHAGVNRETGETPDAVHVLRVGVTRYIVFNYSSRGEFTVYNVFDENFAFLISILS